MITPSMIMMVLTIVVGIVTAKVLADMVD